MVQSYDDKDQRNSVNGNSKSVERIVHGEQEQNYTDLHREINSPRQDKRDRNSPVKEVKNDRHTSDDLNKAKPIHYEQLKVNLDKTKPPVKQDGDSGQQICEKYYVEKVKIPSNDVTRNNQQTYRRSFSEDSYRNAIDSTYTSSIDTGHVSNPSLVTEGNVKSGPPSPGTPDSAGSYEKKALLNNERNVNTQSGISNDVRLKFYQNELEKESETIKSGRSEQLEKPHIPPKQYNQTKNNNKSKSDSNNSQTVRADVYATPQQNRKSPSPPVQNGRGPWLTPQPQRKYPSNSDSHRVMERQSSVPNKSHQPSYFEQQLERQRQADPDSQPSSLPIEINYTSEKPPLPRPGTSQRVPGRQKSQEQILSQSYDSSDRDRVMEAVINSRVEAEYRTPRDERRTYENDAMRKHILEAERMERARSVERDRGQGNIDSTNI